MIPQENAAEMQRAVDGDVKERYRMIIDEIVSICGRVFTPVYEVYTFEIDSIRRNTCVQIDKKHAKQAFKQAYMKGDLKAAYSMEQLIGKTQKIPKAEWKKHFRECKKAGFTTLRSYIEWLKEKEKEEAERINSDPYCFY